jgi:hypothetical protein
VTASGGDDNDIFVVLRNLADVTLYGDNGDDDFVVKAFALAGSTASRDSAIKQTNVTGGDGKDSIFNIQLVITYF